MGCIICPILVNWHPKYDDKGGVPALSEVQFKPCEPTWLFWQLFFLRYYKPPRSYHQNRSHESLIDEAQMMINMDNFKGYIHDVGGAYRKFPSFSL